MAKTYQKSIIRARFEYAVKRVNKTYGYEAIQFEQRGYKVFLKHLDKDGHGFAVGLMTLTKALEYLNGK